MAYSLIQIVPALGDKQQIAAVTAVDLSDIQPKFIASFLEHLERDRGNLPRSRNIRLAALRSFLKFAARRDIANLSFIGRTCIGGAAPISRIATRSDRLSLTL